MSDYSSEDFHGLDLSEFTAEDFAHIDANIASLSRTGSYGSTEVAERSFEKRIPFNSFYSDGSDTDDEDIHCANEESFRSDTFDLNLSSLTNEELATLDKQALKEIPKPGGGPSITIEIEGLVDEPETSKRSVEKSKHATDTGKPWLPNSPLDQFRSYMTLSVTDLTSPAW